MALAAARTFPRPRPRPRARAHSASAPALELSLAALVIVAIFAVALIAPLPFWQAQPPAPDRSGAPPPANLGWAPVLLAICFALALCAPYRPYAKALSLANSVSTRTLLLLTAALALTALLVYPGFGGDLFVYLDYERLWAVYGANPLLAYPNLHPEDWAFRFTWIPEQPNPYGPLWSFLTWPIARLAGDSVSGSIVGYKLLSLLSYVTCCALIWQSVDAGRRNRALAVFAWSPLVLFELLGKGHNDGLLAVSALATIWLARRHPTAGMLAATCGMLVKLSGFALVLGLALSLARQRRWRLLSLSLASAAALTIALYAPFWTGPSTLMPVLFQTSRVVWSPGALLIGTLTSVLSNVDLLARALTTGAFAVACALVAHRGRALAHDTASLLLAAVLLLTSAFFAHYLVPVIALAAVAGSPRLERLAFVLSIGGLAAYAVELLGPALPPGWIGSSGYQILGSLLTLAPAAGLVLAWAARLPPNATLKFEVQLLDVK